MSAPRPAGRSAAGNGSPEALFARECRRLRLQAGWGQAGLAAEAGVTQSTVSTAESGARVSPRARDAIAAALGTTTEAMITGAVLREQAVADCHREFPDGLLLGDGGLARPVPAERPRVSYPPPEEAR